VPVPCLHRLTYRRSGISQVWWHGTSWRWWRLIHPSSDGLNTEPTPTTPAQKLGQQRRELSLGNTVGNILEKLDRGNLPIAGAPRTPHAPDIDLTQHCQGYHRLPHLHLITSGRSLMLSKARRNRRQIGNGPRALLPVRTSPRRHTCRRFYKTYGRTSLLQSGRRSIHQRSISANSDTIHFLKEGNNGSS